ncbi:ankyrin repeat domain-containing protein [Paenibacillus sp. OV219]|uniref:ankyrin repeat domain-containing protein n=1 Tax=Paenibacillus sp. OV219 TaxID=1884377 RepID=UPI0008BB294D|nr:ankyrin repeat domain-containing protein [Paenibacillus sp. OV219]SEO49347.1 Ankyrin repeat-containing protein [Paenibacillus sp. OV219]
MSYSNEIDFEARDIDLAEVFREACRAVKSGAVERLAELLWGFPALAEARSMQGRTLLHHLCDWPGHYPRQLEIGQALLAAGADVNARAIDLDRGETGLQWAASNDDVQMAALLLDAGASVNGLNDDRRPLAQAIWYGCTQVRDLLLARGAALDLELAAAVGRTELLPGFFGEDGQLLNSAGVHREPVNTPITGEPVANELLQQALIYACIGGRVGAAAFMLDRGADVNAIPRGFDETGGAALHWAAASGNVALVELLHSRGADLGKRDRRYNSTPAGWANHFKQAETEARLLRLDSEA